MVAADCLFFKDFHDALINLLCSCTKSDGKILMMQPRRGDSLRTFTESASQYFKIDVEENFSDEMLSLHREYLSSFPDLYDPDIHQQILLTLRHK